MKIIYFITGNDGKVAEVAEKTQHLNVTIKQKNLGYPEIQADGLEEVVIEGIKHIQTKFSKPFIVEDAGLFITSLKGFPGVYSKYVYYTIGLDGILKLMKQKSDRTATFRSVYGYVNAESKSQIFIGECDGIIAQEKRGSHGFGYDPIFIPNGDVRTFAEMNINEKNQRSHRGQALTKLLEKINSTD